MNTTMTDAGRSLDLIDTLTSSGLGSGLHAIERYAECYERNGDVATAAWARAVAARLARNRAAFGSGPHAAMEPETLQAAKPLTAVFWFNNRIYRVQRVRRCYTDIHGVGWAEVDAWCSETEQDGDEDENIVVSVPLRGIQITA